MGNRPSSPVPAVAGGGQYDLAILFSHYGNDILSDKIASYKDNITEVLVYKKR